MANAPLAALLASLVLVGAAGRAYFGIARARAPFNAPESHEEVDRRRRLKAEHLAQARMALVVVTALVPASVMWLVVDKG